MSEVANYFSEEEIRRVENKPHSQYSDILELANFIQYKKNQILENKTHYLLTIYLKNLIILFSYSNYKLFAHYFSTLELS